MTTPTDRMTIAEIIHDFATRQGDLTDRWAREDLAAILERRMDPYRAVLGLFLEHLHIGISNEWIVVEDVTFDAPAPIRKALGTLMEEWVDGEADQPAEVANDDTIPAATVKSSGQVVDLLAALQKSLTAAKATRTTETKGAK